MPEGIVDPQMMQRLAAQLRARDERERVARLARAEAAIPPVPAAPPVRPLPRREEMYLHGPVPLEFTPTPQWGPSGENLDPRFGAATRPYGLEQAMAMTEPVGSPERARAIQSGVLPAAAAESVYPAVEEARRAHSDARAEWIRRPLSGDPRLGKPDYGKVIGAMEQSWDYAQPGLGATLERDRLRDERARETERLAGERLGLLGERQVLVDESRAREAARQRRLSDAFGSPEDRARRIMELEASLRRE